MRRAESGRREESGEEEVEIGRVDGVGRGAEEGYEAGGGEDERVQEVLCFVKLVRGGRSERDGLWWKGERGLWRRGSVWRSRGGRLRERKSGSGERSGESRRGS